MFFVIFFHYFLRPVYVIFQQLYLSILRQHLRSTETHAAHVYIDRAFHAAPTGLLHSLPVLERVTNQQVRRNSGYGIIEVAHFHGVQGYFYHRTIRTVLWHGNPIAHFQHIVGRKLNTGHKSHNTVFEYQHQDGSRSSESRQQHHRTLINQNTDDDNSPYKEKDDLCRLQKSLQRLVPILLFPAVYLINGSKQRTDKPQEHCKDINHAKPA